MSKVTEQLSAELAQMVGEQFKTGFLAYERALKSLADSYGRALEANTRILLQEIGVEVAVRERQIAELKSELAALKGQRVQQAEGERLQ